jgi:hypothetical protein
MDPNIEKLADELLSKWAEYQTLKKRMELMDGKVKDEMIKKNIKVHECSSGTIMIVSQNRQVLNRELIPNIEDYMENTTVLMSFKSINHNKKVE